MQSLKQFRSAFSNFINKKYIYASLAGVILLILPYQNFTLFGSVHHLAAFPNVCNSGSQTTCEVEVDWNTGSGKSACLYRARDKSRLACASSKRIKFLASTTGDALQLRAGTTYDSTLIDEIQVAAIQIDGRVIKRNLNYKNRLVEPLVKAKNSFIASTWDGKIFFAVRNVKLPNGSTRQGFEARALNDREFAGKTPDEVDFAAAHTRPFILTMDPLRPGEPEAIAAQLQGRVGGLENVLKNEGNSYDKAHMTLYPDPDYHENPYRSDRLGRSDDRGEYLTYRFGAVLAASKVLREDGRSTVSTSYVQFLTHTDGYVTVKTTGRSPEIIAGEMRPVVPMRDENGLLFAGHEASVTLDGRLLTYDGQPTITRDGKSYKLTGYNNFLMYTYRTNLKDPQGFKKPRSISDMYFVDGPGRGSLETRIDNIPFSVHYPLAKYPIRDDLGHQFQADQPVSGSYPWISLDGADVVYSSIFSYSGNQRRGTALVGARTRGQIRYVDSGMNVLRGVSPFDEPILSSGAQAELNKAYSELEIPGHGGKSLGENAQWNILFSHLVEFPTSWDGLRDVADPGFPFSFADEAYGFFVSPTARYAEVPLPSIAEDLLLWLPMNESIRYSRLAADEYIQNPSRDTRQVVTGFRQTLAPDNSMYHQTGKLNSNAHFPYEFYDVKNRWVQNRELMDRYEGVIGNSVFLSNGGQINVTMSEASLQTLNDHRRFYLSFWVRPSDIKDTPLFSWNRVLKAELTASNRLVLTHTLKNVLDPDHVREEVKQTVNFGGVRGQWKHILISRDLDTVRVYLDSALQASLTLKENSFPNWLTFPHNQVIVGPSAINRLDVDEVQIGTARLDDKTILQLARIKASDEEWPGVARELNRGAYFTARGLKARVPPNNPFSLEAARAGELLFNEKSLSSNGLVSCASCHVNSRSFADSKAFSRGVNGFTGRNAPALINLAFADSFFWDGSAKTLESQVLHPFLHPDEMGLTISSLVSKIQAKPALKAKLSSVYGGAVTPTVVAKALATYVRSLTTPDFNFQPKELNPLEQKGWALFNGRGNCVACHSGALFTDGLIHDLGLAEVRMSNGRFDFGAYNSLKDEKTRFAMKTPSLINVRQTAPYFHDGRFTSLEEVVEFYNRGGDESSMSRSGRSPLIRPLGLTSEEKASLVAFLRSLNGRVE
jgi:cytochrome c peroxidase